MNGSYDRERMRFHSAPPITRQGHLALVSPSRLTHRAASLSTSGLTFNPFPHPPRRVPFNIGTDLQSLPSPTIGTDRQSLPSPTALRPFQHRD